MRLTVSAFGLELDITLGVATTAEQAEGNSLDGGTTASYPVGFTARHDVPADLPWVERDNGWGDEDG